MQKKLLILVLFISLTTSSAFSMLKSEEKFFTRFITAFNQLDRNTYLDIVNESFRKKLQQIILNLTQLSDDLSNKTLNEKLMFDIEGSINNIILIVSTNEETKSLLEELKNICNSIMNLRVAAVSQNT